MNRLHRWLTRVGLVNHSPHWFKAHDLWLSRHGGARARCTYCGQSA